MIREKIKEEMKAQNKKQLYIVDKVNELGQQNKIQVTQAQLSNFLSEKSLLNIAVVELILHELGLTIEKNILTIDKIELERLAPYLPYQLQIGKYFKGEFFQEELEIGNMGGLFNGDIKKIILRPIEDLTMEFYWDNLRDGDFQITEDSIKEILSNPLGQRKYYQTLYLLAHHFDIYKLIPKGLAIDINNL